MWTSGSLDKLAVYSGLGVGEVWFWREGRIEVHVLRGGAYARVERSALLPDLDLELLSRFLTYEDQTRAAREYLVALGPRTRPSIIPGAPCCARRQLILTGSVAARLRPRERARQEAAATPITA